MFSVLLLHAIGASRGTSHLRTSCYSGSRLAEVAAGFMRESTAPKYSYNFDWLSLTEASSAATTASAQSGRLAT